MGVLLGVAVELLVLLALGMAGKLPPLLTILADTAQKVTWSTLVCAALAAAQTLVRVQALGMAAAGLLGAPIALLLARSVHKAVNAALDAAPAAAQTATPWVLAGLKGVEYALLGLLLIRLAKRARGLGAHAAAGAGLGLAFFGVLTWLMPLDGVQPQLLRAINEVLHPMGCALVIYFGAQFGSKLGARAGGIADDN
ncbi:hypothetical protein FCE95_00700 [Luteimonas gilva]|uniref:Uncharacterized protein n=1 Tax=Luteimonas gilva TaxID=2572684 RepID=A0A4U5K1T0_9GAMM|nr:hypothetical protein [Luteimonas gilva]TKR32889.1 hypothetical protein FCE95_00700 [Luteimonas gilva]